MLKVQVSAALAAAAMLMTAGSALASPCTNTCTTKFTACQKGANTAACQSQWMKCRKQCTGGAAKPMATGATVSGSSMQVNMGQTGMKTAAGAKTTMAAKAH